MISPNYTLSKINDSVCVDFSYTRDGIPVAPKESPK